MRRFLKSFEYAYEGIIHAFKTERNFRFHIITAVVVIILGILTKLTVVEWFVVLILIGGVIALELVNTAIERVIDLTISERHPLAKQAKDLAAGAVLIFAIVSAIIGFLLFLPKWLA